MQSSDSLVAIDRRSGFPSRDGLPLGTGACSSPFGARTRERAKRRRRVTGSPLHRVLPRRNEGLPGSWAVLFVRAVVDDPAGCAPPLAHDGEGAVAFRTLKSLGTRNVTISWLHNPRPTRSRAYASPSALPHPSQGSLPTGRAHPWSGGFRTRWTTNEVSWSQRILQSSSTSLSWSHSVVVLEYLRQRGERDSTR
jgi:hypothetical protein